MSPIWWVVQLFLLGYIGAAPNCENVKKDEKLRVIPHLTRDWSMSFDFTVKDLDRYYRRDNLIYMVPEGKTMHIPKIDIRKYSDNQHAIEIYYSGKVGDSVQGKFTPPANGINKFEMEMSVMTDSHGRDRTLFVVKVNGEEIHNRNIATTHEFTNVIVYTGKGNRESQGTLCNLVINTACENNEKDANLRVIPWLRNTWSMSFDYTVKNLENRWHNLIYLQADGMNNVLPKVELRAAYPPKADHHVIQVIYSDKVGYTSKQKTIKTGPNGISSFKMSMTENETNGRITVHITANDVELYNYDVPMTMERQDVIVYSGKGSTASQGTLCNLNIETEPLVCEDTGVNKLLQTIPYMDREWSLSFMFTAKDLQVMPDNLLYLEADNRPTTLPRIQIAKYSMQVFYMGADGAYFQLPNIKNTLNPIGKFNFFEMSTRLLANGKTEFTVKINGEVIGRASAAKETQAYWNVGIYTGKGTARESQGKLCDLRFATAKPECGEGFAMNKGECQDIDECTTRFQTKQGKPCGKDLQCVNTIGGYECKAVPVCEETGVNKMIRKVPYIAREFKLSFKFTTKELKYWPSDNLLFISAPAASLPRIDIALYTLGVFYTGANGGNFQLPRISSSNFKPEGEFNTFEMEATKQGTKTNFVVKLNDKIVGSGTSTKAAIEYTDVEIYTGKGTKRASQGLLCDLVIENKSSVENFEDTGPGLDLGMDLDDIIPTPKSNERQVGVDITWKTDQKFNPEMAVEGSAAQIKLSKDIKANVGPKINAIAVKNGAKSGRIVKVTGRSGSGRRRRQTDSDEQLVLDIESEFVYEQNSGSANQKATIPDVKDLAVAVKDDMVSELGFDAEAIDITAVVEPWCDQNERFEECGSPCAQTCDHFVNPREVCVLSCVTGCQCVKGHYRNEKETCIPEDTCPIASAPVCENVAKDAKLRSIPNLTRNWSMSFDFTIKDLHPSYLRDNLLYFEPEAHAGRMYVPKIDIRKHSANQHYIEIYYSENAGFTGKGAFTPAADGINKFEMEMTVQENDRTLAVIKINGEELHNQSIPKTQDFTNVVVYTGKGNRESQGTLCNLIINTEQVEQCDGPNEQFNKCGSSCGQDCADFFNPPETCTLECVPECQCTTGHFRNEQGVCVRGDSCPIPVDESPKTCPECWQLQDGKCVAKKDAEKCFNLDCQWDKMNLDFSSTLFGIADNESPAPFKDDKTDLSWATGRWRTSCDLGACGMSAETRQIGDDWYLVFGFRVSVRRAPVIVKGKKIHMENPIAATVLFECAYRQQVKISSTTYEVAAVSADGEAIDFGDLTNGFEIDIYTDPEFTKPVDTTELYIGEPVYVEVGWKVKEVVSVADFFVDECSVGEVDSTSLVLIKENCYSDTFSTEQLQEDKRVGEKSRFKFTSFIVGDGASQMNIRVTCTVKICSLQEDKCDKWTNDKDATCPNDAEMAYRALTFKN